MKYVFTSKWMIVHRKHILLFEHLFLDSLQSLRIAASLAKQAMRRTHRSLQTLLLLETMGVSATDSVIFALTSTMSLVKRLAKAGIECDGGSLARFQKDTAAISLATVLALDRPRTITAIILCLPLPRLLLLNIPACFLVVDLAELTGKVRGSLPVRLLLLVHLSCRRSVILDADFAESALHLEVLLLFTIALCVAIFLPVGVGVKLRIMETVVHFFSLIRLGEAADGRERIRGRARFGIISDGWLVIESCDLCCFHRWRRKLIILGELGVRRHARRCISEGEYRSRRPCCVHVAAGGRLHRVHGRRSLLRPRLAFSVPRLGVHTA